MKTGAWSPSTTRWLAVIGILFTVAACSAAGQEPSSTLTPNPTSASSQAPSPSLAVSTPTLASTPTPASTSTPTASLAPGPTPLAVGPHAAHVIGTGSYPGWTVVVPAGWYDGGGYFVLKYPTNGVPSPVIGLSVWDVGQVFRDPCHWQGQGVDPGPGVAALVAALVAQPMRNATKPTDVTLAGYKGRYLEWSVPADIKSSAPSEFDACDVDREGHHDFQGWLGNGMGNRYEQVPGQVDRLWVLDVRGQRLVVDASYSPDTTQADRDELAQVVKSLRFAAP